MSSNPSRPSSFLDGVAQAGSVLSLGLMVGETVVPLIVGVVKRIESNAKESTTEYTVVLETEQAVLDSVIAGGLADLDEVNAELTRMGLPVLAKPSP